MAVHNRLSHRTLSPSAANFEAHAISRSVDSVDELLAAVPARAPLLLDAGCGSGGLACRLAGRAGFVVGIDLSPELIGLAQTRQRETNIPNLAWVVGSIEHPPFRPETFDVITSSWVLRLTNLPIALEALARLVKPNGRMAIQDVLVRSPGKSPLPLSHLYATLRHMRRNTRFFGWRMMLRITAFRLSRAELVRAARVQRITLAVIERIYDQILPGSNIQKSPWRYVVVWDKSTGATE